MRPDKLTSSLLAHIGARPPGDRGALLELLQQWLKLHLMNWSSGIRGRWGLDEWAELDLSNYPVEESSFDPEEEVCQLKSVPPASMDLMAMRIRDILWAGITVEATVTCPRCGEVQLRILEDPASDTIVLSCDLCAWSQTSHGEPWHGPRHLKPASRPRITRWRHDGS